MTAMVLLLLWMTSSAIALVRLGPYPPKTSAPILFAASFLFAALGARLMSRNKQEVDAKTLVALAAAAAVLPLALGTWVPGIAQLKMYPIPGAPTLVLSAGPGNNDLWMIHGGKAGSTSRLTNTRSIDERFPDLSPDGTQVVYSSNASGDYDIWLMTQDAGDRPLVNRRLTSGLSDDWNPVWSPDGSQIVFSRQDSNTAILESYDVANGKVTPLNPASEVDFNPTWSPDGKHIAYAQEAPEGGSEIWIMNADGSHRHMAIRGNESAYNPHWSPDGKFILFTAKPDTGERDAYTANVDGTNMLDITQGSAAREDAFGWTPTGLPLFLSNRTGTDGAFVYVCDLDGSNVRLVATI